MKKVKILTIGQRTADQIRSHNMRVSHIFRDSNDLLERISSMIAANSSILYLCGHDVTENMTEKLEQIGFDIRRVICYRAYAARSLPKGWTDGVQYVSFYSTRTAKVFKKINKENLRNLAAICLSDKIAKEIADIGFKKIIVASYPSDDALMETIISLYDDNAQQPKKDL